MIGNMGLGNIGNFRQQLAPPTAPSGGTAASGSVSNPQPMQAQPPQGMMGGAMPMNAGGGMPMNLGGVQRPGMGGNIPQGGMGGGMFASLPARPTMDQIHPALGNVLQQISAHPGLMQLLTQLHGQRQAAPPMMNTQPFLGRFGQ